VVAGALALGEMDAVTERATWWPGRANVPAADLYISKRITRREGSYRSNLPSKEHNIWYFMLYFSLESPVTLWR